jgi:hypothetical protein
VCRYETETQGVKPSQAHQPTEDAVVDGVARFYLVRCIQVPSDVGSVVGVHRLWIPRESLVHRIEEFSSPADFNDILECIQEYVGHQFDEHRLLFSLSDHCGASDQ